MGVDACQHVAVRVSDIDRAARFYLEVFEGRWLTLPFTISGPELEPLFGNHEGLRLRVCLLGFDRGCVELFEFLEPRLPPRTIDPARDNIVHWCFQVDDVEATVVRVEAAAGRTVHPVMDWGGSSFVYCADPDGNVFELVESTVADTVHRTLALFPDATPGL